MTKVCVRVCVWGGGHIFCFVEYFDKSQFFVTPPCSPSLSVPVWPDDGIQSSPKFPKSGPKGSHSSFYLKSGVFQNIPESYQTYGLLLYEKIVPEIIKNRSIWSHDRGWNGQSSWPENRSERGQKLFQDGVGSAHSGSRYDGLSFRPETSAEISEINRLFIWIAHVTIYLVEGDEGLNLPKW